MHSKIAKWLLYKQIKMKRTTLKSQVFTTAAMYEQFQQGVVTFDKVEAKMNCNRKKYRFRGLKKKKGKRNVRCRCMFDIRDIVLASNSNPISARV